MVTRLERYQRQYQNLQAQLGEIGFISSGSIVCRHTSCGKPGCRCQADPPQLHGPYWQWTRKVGGRTITRRLDEAEAELYREWIANGRRLAAIVAQMEKVSGDAAQLLLRQATSASTG
ncbi:MAG: hypothetical protein M3378_08450 [Actinomycetota bacterium]|nr:hypothetical protein [Actinomycetota bacterium]MDQ3680554.1 hypothetical protein [Actinomycetota bacterium]